MRIYFTGHLASDLKPVQKSDKDWPVADDDDAKDAKDKARK